MIPEHIFFDLDGTLIGSSGDVKATVWAAIDKLRGHIGMSVCTGRPRAGIAQRVAERLDPEGLHIFENGGMVAPALGEPVFTSSLGPADLTTIAAAARTIDAAVEFYTASDIFVSRLDADCCAHARAIGTDIRCMDLDWVIANYEVIRAHWIMREPAVAYVLALALHDAEVGVASSPVLPGMIFASTTRRGTSKGSAAAELAGRVGVSLANCAGIGDAVGDLPLLEAVGAPYVVANSSPELLQRFPTLGHVDELGVLPLLATFAAR